MCPSPRFRVLALTLALVAPALLAHVRIEAETTAPGHGDAAAGRTALAKMPHYEEPESYSVNLVIDAGGESFKIKRYIDKGRVRTEMNAHSEEMVMIEMGDEKGTLYHAMPKQKKAMKMSTAGMTAMSKQAEKVEADSETETESEPETPEMPPDVNVEYLGDETIDGQSTSKFRMTMPEGSGLAWFNAASGAPVRMESTVDGKPAVMEWKDYQVGPQPASLFEVPKSYEIIDMDAMMAQAQASGMGGMGNPLAGMMGGMTGGMAGGMAQNMGQSMGSSLGSQVGGAFGGPLGAMAGGYLGGKLGGFLGKKAVSAIH